MIIGSVLFWQLVIINDFPLTLFFSITTVSVFPTHTYAINFQFFFTFQSYIDWICFKVFHALTSESLLGFVSVSIRHIKTVKFSLNSVWLNETCLWNSICSHHCSSSTVNALLVRLARLDNWLCRCWFLLSIAQAERKLNSRIY